MISSKRKVIGELKTDRRVKMAFSSPKDKEEQEYVHCLCWLVTLQYFDIKIAMY